MSSYAEQPSVPGQSAALRCDLFLSVFLRLVACGLMIRGLFRWADMVGLNGTPDGLLSMALHAQLEVCFFAIVFLVAATGLWILSSWGVVVWISAVLLDAVLGFFLPQYVSLNPLLLGVDGACVLIYLALLYMRERAHAKQGY